ncbi:hypothetical protein QYF36_009606 [Acer negundo]|nr:hypothetical protein QYF36_009606 [Acer negundo]
MSSSTSFGYIFFIFLIGVKMDVKLITKLTKREWYISRFLMMNMMLVTICAVQIKKAMDPVENLRDWISFFAGTLMLTSFPVVACFLIDLKIINSELGHIALSTALVADLMSVFVVNFYDYARIMVDASFRAGIKSMILSLALLVFISTALSVTMLGFSTYTVVPGREVGYDRIGAVSDTDGYLLWLQIKSVGIKPDASSFIGFCNEFRIDNESCCSICACNLV